MPIFDYKCKKCSHTFEHLVLKAEDILSVHCPKCTSVDTVQMVGTPSFRLYGEGFHKRHHKDTGDWS